MKGFENETSHSALRYLCPGVIGAFAFLTELSQGEASGSYLRTSVRAALPEQLAYPLLYLQVNHSQQAGPALAAKELFQQSLLMHLSLELVSPW